MIVADKQPHLQYLDMDAAIKHCTKGLGIWPWASTDQGGEPDLVMASCGDIATMEALAATALLRQQFPDLKMRFVNVVDLFRLLPEHRASARADGSGVRQPVHHRQADDLQVPRVSVADPPADLSPHEPRRTCTSAGYKEKGNINTPMELAIQNQIDRFTLAMDAIDRVPALATAAPTRGIRCATNSSSAGPTRTGKASTRPRSSAGVGEARRGPDRPVGTTPRE